MNAYTLNPQAIALNRFGLGVRLDETLPTQPKAWLISQLDTYNARPQALARLKGTVQIAEGMVRWKQWINNTQDKQRKQLLTARMRIENRSHYVAAANARLTQALVTTTPFVERLVHFWANHFAVSAEKVVVIPYAGSFEMEAIRPHVLGNFTDMLLEVERHAAMLVFLDQADSMGPNSAFAAAQRSGAAREQGLNENLAREILELHTLGVRSGYTQSDVTEFARALTGWTVGAVGAGRDLNAKPGIFGFVMARHEPGSRTLLGRRYAQGGEEQATAMLRDLAQAPATARHIAGKLARHFCGDEPPVALVNRLTRAFLDSRGDLPTLYRALIESPEVWVTQPLRFKTPWEWVVSALRGIGVRHAERAEGLGVLRRLGQPTWTPGSPAGWSDATSSWASPDALMRRVDTASFLVGRLPVPMDPRLLLEHLLVTPASPVTRSIVLGAESEVAGLTLLLVSPEFQRR